MGLAEGFPDGDLDVGLPLTEVSWLFETYRPMPACLVVVQAMMGADRASFPGLGDPAKRGQ
jgi:hypothetical protein